MRTFLLDQIPLSVLALATVVFVLLSLELGFRLGRWRRNRTGAEHDTTLAGVVGGTLGLLAFLLAFSFGMAASRFEDRRQVLLDQTNALDQAFLRSDLMDEPNRSVVRQLLRQYVQIELNAARAHHLAEVQRSDDLQKQLWDQVVPLGREQPSSAVKALVIESINNVIETNAKRVDMVRHRIPTTLWIALYFLTIVAMASIGYQSGVSGPRRSPAIPALALTFCIVIALIADLDRPLEGLLTVSQQAMIDLQNKMTDSP